MKVILASASPRRKELLELIGLKFEILPSGIDEIMDDSLPIGKRVEMLAYQKAYDIARKTSENVLIIGADTIVEIHGKILGKPKNRDDAKEMLKMLSGTTHKVITAISLIPTSTDYPQVTTHESTQVKFKNLTEDEINNYIDSGEPMDKAGAYAIQGLGVMLVETINGCYTNVVGLPIPLLTKHLANDYSIRLI